MFESHKYFVYATGVKNFQPKYFCSRPEAESYMHLICIKNNIYKIECYEYDKHERAYTNHNGVRFYINRV